MCMKLYKCYIFFCIEASYVFIIKKKQICCSAWIVSTIPIPLNCLKTTLLDALTVKTTTTQSQK